MQTPLYIYLPNHQFIRVIANQEIGEATLFHPFKDGIQVNLTGDFAENFFNQLKGESVQSSVLCLVEKQHEWLEGLQFATQKYNSFKSLVVGDELGLLFLEITDQCNEQCIHCYASSSPACSDFLTIDEIKSILEQGRALGRPFVQFTGGDPLIHRNLVEAVAYADGLDYQGIEIYTNGLLLTDKLLAQLQPFDPMMAFSLYSPDESVHDGITQVKGSFKKTVAAIHRAQDLALKVRIGMAVMEQNAGHEQAMLDFANAEFSLDKRSVRFDPVHETGRGEALNTKHISLMPSQNSHMPDSVKAKEFDKKHHHQVVQQDKVTTGTPSTQEDVGRRGKLAVCASGNVSPCIFNREHVLGNIRQQSFEEILRGQRDYEGNLSPDVERWNFCQHNLSCADCQMVAYTLGETS